MTDITDSEVEGVASTGLFAMSIAAHANAASHGFHDAEDDILAILKANGSQRLVQAFEVLTGLAKLMLITTEVAEAAEALRKGSTVNYQGELADIVIRVGDESRRVNAHLGMEVVAKMRRNTDRPPMHGGKLA